MRCTTDFDRRSNSITFYRYFCRPATWNPAVDWNTRPWSLIDHCRLLNPCVDVVDKSASNCREKNATATILQVGNKSVDDVTSTAPVNDDVVWKQRRSAKGVHVLAKRASPALLLQLLLRFSSVRTTHLRHKTMNAVACKRNATCGRLLVADLLCSEQARNTHVLIQFNHCCTGTNALRSE